jgi:hypothetical protein
MNRQGMFFLTSTYVLEYNLSAISATFILVDRCTALIFPIHYTKTMGEVLVRIFVVFIAIFTIILGFQFVAVDGASFYNASKSNLC